MNTINEIEIKYTPTSVCNRKLFDARAVAKVGRKLIGDDMSVRECCIALFTNNALECIGVYVVGKGGICAVETDIRLLFAAALKSLATGIVLIHNHPSGRLDENEIDLSMTRKVKDAAKLLEIQFHDHVVVTPDSYYSYSENGHI
ncbi:MAG: hypothetical protein LBC84_09290 [Prevotellaceae bacterium]|jgi:DNA repair protein RadC|nr:hypothetical protein [Prevotellaceae bacterium]